MRQRLNMGMLLAAMALFLGIEARRAVPAWGLDVAIAPSRTSFVLTAATVRLAFIFGQDCSKTDSAGGAALSAQS